MCLPYLQAVLAGLVVLAVLLTAPTQCSKQFMWDPAAQSECLEHVEDMTFVKPECMKARDVAAEKQEQAKRSKRLVRTDTVLWENGVIPYTFGPFFSEDDIERVVKAMSHYEENTCLRFKERTDEEDYIEYEKGLGCRSFVGRVPSGGRQGLSLLTSCLEEFGTILHEIGHAIGFLHEQSRPDRDHYVDVIYGNINDGQASEFERKEYADVDTLGVGYDYNSIMHYDSDAFGIDGRTTLAALDPSIPIGGATVLSYLDIEKINRLYNCQAPPPPRSTVHVPHPPDPVPPRMFACGEFYDDLVGGVISSPGFPTYLEDQDCHWQLRARDGFQIRLEITSLNLHTSADCNENYIEIYERLDCTGFRRARICSPSSFLTYVTFGNTGCVLYHSGRPQNSQQLQGFQMSFSRSDIDECHPALDFCEDTCTNFPGGYACSCPEGYFLAADGRSCFDFNECALEERNICEYQCVNFGGYHQCLCPDGSLQEDDSCSTEVNECLTDNGGCSHYCTNTEDSYTCSCYANYILADDQHTCIRIPIAVGEKVGQGPQDSGTIMTPNWPETYPLNFDEVFLIQCPKETQNIELVFSSPYGIGGQMPDCPKDWLRIHDGNSNELLQQYCHLSVPLARNYTLHTLSLEFHAGPQHGSSRKGFKATYRCWDVVDSVTTPIPTTEPTQAPTTEALTSTKQMLTTTQPPTECPPVSLQNSLTCGSVFTEETGEISSPNWPQSYNTNEQCEWIIVLPDCTKGIEITFKTVSIAGQPPDCPKDQIFVREGLGEGGELHGPFCHFTEPPPLMINSHIANITMNAGPYHSSAKRGFLATYKSVEIME